MRFGSISVASERPLDHFRPIWVGMVFSAVATIAQAQINLRELTAAEKRVVANSIETQVVDPTSVLFKWPLFKIPGSSPQVNYCGLFDAKNRMGGYVGFRPYLSKVTLDANGVAVATTVFSDERNLIEFNIKICKTIGYDLDALSQEPATH